MFTQKFIRIFYRITALLRAAYFCKRERSLQVTKCEKYVMDCFFPTKRIFDSA